MAVLERVASFAAVRKTASFEFYQKTRITLAVVNILANYNRQSGCGSDGSMTSIKQQLNHASVLGEATSLAEPRTAVLGVQVYKLFGITGNCVTKPDCRLTRIYLTRNAGLSASAELLVFNRYGVTFGNLCCTTHKIQQFY